MRARTAFRLRDERLPDELRNVEDRLARAHLACPDAHHVVEPPVSLVIAQVRGDVDDMSSLRWIGAAVAEVVQHDERSVTRPMSPWKPRANVPSVRRRGWLAPRTRVVIRPSDRPSARKKYWPSVPSGPEGVTPASYG